MKFNIQFFKATNQSKFNDLKRCVDCNLTLRFSFIPHIFKRFLKIQMFVVVISQLHLQNHFSMASNSEPKLIFCQKLTNCELCHISKMAPHKWMTFLNFDTYSNFFYQMKKPHLAKTVISF